MSLPVTKESKMRANGVTKNAIRFQHLRPHTFFIRVAATAAVSCMVCCSFLQSVATAATVNVSIDPAVNPIQVAGTTGNSIPDGTALFVVSYKTTQDAFFTALRGASSASDLVTVFSNQLKFFNAVPFLKGAYDVDSAIGWSSEGGAITQVDTTTTSNLPIFALFSSSTNPFDSGADFLLVKSRGTAADSYIPKDDSPSSIEISGTATGSDVIFGQYFD
ncbi:MAG: hypothetical protein EBT07_11795, partial [Actinobacteria bacterium]|nr:hypothetical protein [Actinomycetota bacterium]